MNSIIYRDIEYGKVICNLDAIMKRKNITTYRLSIISNIKYDVIERYRYNIALRYDSYILAKLCFYLDCDLSSLLKYEK